MPIKHKKPVVLYIITAVYKIFKTAYRDYRSFFHKFATDLVALSQGLDALCIFYSKAFSAMSQIRFIYFRTRIKKVCLAFFFFFDNFQQLIVARLVIGLWSFF